MALCSGCRRGFTARGPRSVCRSPALLCSARIRAVVLSSQQAVQTGSAVLKGSIRRSNKSPETSSIACRDVADVDEPQATRGARVGLGAAGAAIVSDDLRDDAIRQDRHQQLPRLEDEAQECTSVRGLRQPPLPGFLPQPAERAYLGRCSSPIVPDSCSSAEFFDHTGSIAATF